MRNISFCCDRCGQRIPAHLIHKWALRIKRHWILKETYEGWTRWRWMLCEDCSKSFFRWTRGDLEDLPC
jgi:hypothetical protein